MGFYSVATRLARGAFFVVCVYVLLVPIATYASTWENLTQWNDTRNHGRGAWYDLAISADGLTQVTVDITGLGDPRYLYTSTDGGDNWTARTSLGEKSWGRVAISSDGATMFAVGDNSIWRSTDGGANWTELTSAGSRSWIDIAASDNGQNLVAIVYNGYIYTSTDGGDNWTEQTSAGTNTWRTVDMSADGSRLVIVNSFSGGFLWTSTDGGANWTQQTGAGARWWGEVSMSGDGMSLVAVVQNGYPYVSTDGGVTWATSTSVGVTAWSTTKISSDGSRIIVARGGGYATNTLMSIDNGATWTDLSNRNRASSSLSNFSPGAIGISSDGSRIAIADYGRTIHQSADSGATWTFDYYPEYAGWYRISMSDDGETVLAQAYASWGAGTQAGYLFTSTDGGSSWVVRTNAGIRNWTGGVAVSSDGTTMIAATYEGYIYKSTDDGATWNELTNAGSRRWNDVAISSDGAEMVGVVLTTGQIFTSTDGGSNWTERTGGWSGAVWRAVDMSPDGTYIVVGDTTLGEIWLSTDEGATWAQKFADGTSRFGEVAISADGEVIIAGDYYNDGLWLSFDGGDTWVDKVASTTGDAWDGVDVSDDGTKFIAVSNGEYIYTSVDSGTTWVEETSNKAGYWYDARINRTGEIAYVLAANTNGSGDPQDIHRGSLVFTVPPTLSNISATPSDTAATITWDTDILSNSRVVYGLTSSYGSASAVADTGLVTDGHSISLSGLSAGTTYHYAIVSADAQGNTSTSSDQTFTTTGVGGGGGGGGGDSGSGGGNGIKISLSNLFGLGDDNDDVPAEEESNDSLIDNILDIFGNNDEVDAPTSNAPAAIQGGQGGGAGGESNEVPQERNVSRPTEHRGTEAQPSAAPIEPPVLLPSRLPSDAGRLLEALSGLGAATLGFMRAHDQELAITALSLGSLLWLLKYLLIGTGLLLRARSVTDFFFIVRGAWNRFLSFIGARAKRRHWGTVYDSDSKQALDPALVELIDSETQAVLEQSFTDIQGKYGFLDRVGSFVIRARKTNYSFPSHKVTGDNDMMFENIYHGERFTITAVNDEAITPNIPMDQVSTDWNQEEKKRMGLHRGIKMDAFINDVSAVVFWLGYAVSLAVVATNPHFLNGLLAVVYTLMVGISTYWPAPRLWGQLKSSRRSVEGLTVALRHPQQLSTIVSKAQTDAQGRFFLKATPGDYQLDILSRNELMEVSIAKREVRVKEEGVVNETVKI